MATVVCLVFGLNVIHLSLVTIDSIPNQKPGKTKSILSSKCCEMPEEDAIGVDVRLGQGSDTGLSKLPGIGRPVTSERGPNGPQTTWTSLANVRQMWRRSWKLAKDRNPSQCDFITMLKSGSRLARHCGSMRRDEMR